MKSGGTQFQVNQRTNLPILCLGVSKPPDSKASHIPTNLPTAPSRGNVINPDAPPGLQPSATPAPVPAPVPAPPAPAPVHVNPDDAFPDEPLPEVIVVPLTTSEGTVIGRKSSISRKGISNT